MGTLLQALQLSLIIGFYCLLFVHAQNDTSEPPLLPSLINKKETQCAPGFFRLGTSCFLLYNGTHRGFTWREAREECKGLAAGADLARITSQTNQDYFTALMPFVSQSAWIGLRVRRNAPQGAGPTGVYEWISTSNRTATHQPDVGFFNWAARRYLDAGGHPGAVQTDEDDDDGNQACVFLSSGGGHQTGQWIASSCRLRMGFLCEQTKTNAANATANATRSSAVTGAAATSLQSLIEPPAAAQSTCLPGFFLYLGTCYRLLPTAPVPHAEAAAICQNHTSPMAVTLALPRSPVHLAFLRFLISSTRLLHDDGGTDAMAVNDRHAWISVTASVKESQLRLTDTPHPTPWLTRLVTAVVSRQQPQQQLDALHCFQISARPDAAPLIASSCVTSQAEPGALPLCSHEAMASELEAGRRETAASLCQSIADSSGGSHGNRWMEFQGACYTVLSVPSPVVANISSLCESLVPAGALTSILSVEEQAFITQLADQFDSDFWIGGYVKPKNRGHIYWFDESPDNGFSRLQPGLGTAGNESVTGTGGEDEKKCLVLQKVSGWWVQRSCDGGSPPQPSDDGQNPPPMAVCKTRLPVIASTSTPDTVFLTSSVSEDLGVKEETDYRLTCPEGFSPAETDIFSELEATLSRPKTCYRIFVAGRRAQAYNWEAAEKHCSSLVKSTNKSWTGHLASLPERVTSQTVLRTMRPWGIGVTLAAADDAEEHAPVLAPRIIKTSELAWIGLSASLSSRDERWNNWTDGSQGEATFYVSRLQESFATETDDFFDQGHCIAIHIPTGLWYALRCSLDLGHLCQAQLKTVPANDIPTAVFQPPGCLSTLSLASPADPVDASGFVREPEVDCRADGFSYFNKQCYRAIDDRFLSFAEAHAYCKSLAPPAFSDTAGLAVLHSYEDHMFAASLLSELPMLPANNSRYGKLPFISRLEVAWRRYHWLGLFNYRHGSHTVDESAACYVPHEVSTDLHNSLEELPTCFAISGSPEVSSFARLSAEFDCSEKLPFVCSFRPDQLAPAPEKVKQPRTVCPENYAVYRSARGVNCYRFAAAWLGSYDEAAQLCASQSQSAEHGRLAALLSPYHVAWLRAHLPSPTRGGINNWWLQPHWVGLRLPSSPAPGTVSWQWQRSGGSDDSAEVPVTHTEWSSVPIFAPNKSLGAPDICFAFANSPDFNSTELDMVPIDCNRNLSPLCEADSLQEEVEVEVSTLRNTRLCSTEANQEDYSGFLNTTVSGKSCLRWDLITDTAELSMLKEAFHATSLRAVASVIDGRITLSGSDRLKSPAYLPALSAASNWCRNPNGLRKRVFCYVLDDLSNLTWEYCDVPSCQDYYADDDGDNAEGFGQPKAFPSSRTMVSPGKAAPSSAGRIFLYFLSFFCTISLVGGVVFFVYKKRSTFRHFPVGARVPSIFPRARFHSSSSLCLLNDNVTFQNTSETV